MYKAQISFMLCVQSQGWAMQCAAFLFMWRNWSKDKEQITRALRYFALSCTQPQVDSFLEPVFEVIHEHLTQQVDLFYFHSCI